jgi:hypothetical protein
VEVDRDVGNDDALGESVNIVLVVLAESAISRRKRLEVVGSEAARHPEVRITELYAGSRRNMASNPKTQHCGYKSCDIE